MYKDADTWIKELGLLPHPEGGFYKEIYRSSESIPDKGLPSRFHGNRDMATSIYFLLKEGDLSAFHKLLSDEIWHYYAGGPCAIHIITENGKLVHKYLGPDYRNNQHFQVVVLHDCWFAANPLPGSSFTLAGCTMAPGFSFEDFLLGDPEELIRQYPAHKTIIRKFSRIDRG